MEFKDKGTSFKQLQNNLVGINAKEHE